jgi:hypothetical protein
MKAQKRVRIIDERAQEISLFLEKVSEAAF